MRDFLRAQHAAIVPMTFDEIEEVTRVKLPPKAQLHRAWWSNNPSNNVMTRVWIEAGFETEQVDMAARKLVFRRVGGLSERAMAAPASKNGERTRHPLLGALEGLVQVTPGTDLTKPADPNWGDGA